MTAAIERRKTLDMNLPAVVWRAHEGAQTRLLQCPCNEILYGGAKGGGKSDGILGSWIGHVSRNPAWARGIIFRKTYPELEQLIARSHEMFKPLGAIYKSGSKTWFFPGGATLKFRFVTKAADARKYQGHEYTFIGFDEVGDMEDEDVVNILRGALRSSKPISERILIMSGNPLGAGHAWLKKRFIDPAPPEVPILDKLTLPGGQVVMWSRVFIPALIEDNPTLLKNDPGYLLRLEQMCIGRPWLYRALRYGDWTVKREMPGALLTEDQVLRATVGLQSCKIKTLPEMLRTIVGVDPTVKGYDVELPQEEIEAMPGDSCGIIGYGHGIDDFGYILRDDTVKADPTVWARRAVTCALTIGAADIVAESNNGGELVKIQVEAAMKEMNVRGINVTMVPARKGKYLRAAPMAADAIAAKLFFALQGLDPLKGELTTWVNNGRAASPNRIDAATWAWTFDNLGVDNTAMLKLIAEQSKALPEESQDRMKRNLAALRETLARGKKK